MARTHRKKTKKNALPGNEAVLLSNQQVAAALGSFLRLESEFKRLVDAKKPVPRSLIRDTTQAARRAALAYCRPDNWSDRDLDRTGPPVEHFPWALAWDMARNLEILAAGHIPRWMRHLQRRGAPRGHPDMNRDKAVAVAYRTAATLGLVRDRSPVRTIQQAYGGVSKQAVQKWMAEYAHATPDAFGWRTEEDARTALEGSGRRYSESGRAPGIRRPGGKR
jgi:hypothetical protein